jgi:hypothetical protein
MRAHLYIAHTQTHAYAHIQPIRDGLRSWKLKVAVTGLFSLSEKRPIAQPSKFFQLANSQPIPNRLYMIVACTCVGVEGGGRRAPRQIHRYIYISTYEMQQHIHIWGSISYMDMFLCIYMYMHIIFV